VAPAPPETSEWKCDERVERRTGQSASKAFVLTTRVSRRAGRASSRAALELQCFKDKPIVQMRFTERVGGRLGGTVTYRFDDRPPRQPAARFLPDYKALVMDQESDLQQFAAELRSASTLHVTIDSLVAGATRAEFPVYGGEFAIGAGFRHCSLPPPAAPRRAGT